MTRCPDYCALCGLGQELIAAPFSSWSLPPLCCLPQDDLADKADSVSPEPGDTQRGRAAGWDGTLVGQEPRDGWTSVFSPFLVSAADNSKDLATELVHYGFIHEVSRSLLPLLGCAHRAPSCCPQTRVTPVPQRSKSCSVPVPQRWAPRALHRPAALAACVGLWVWFSPYFAHA